MHLRHRWRNIAAKPFILVHDFGVRTDKTRILRRCDVCGRVSTKAIVGRWTLDEIDRGAAR